MNGHMIENLARMQVLWEPRSTSDTTTSRSLIYLTPPLHLPECPSPEPLTKPHPRRDHGEANPP